MVCLFNPETKMEKTNLILTRIPVPEMLLRPEQAYNPSIWKERVNSLAKYDRCQFYVIEPGDGFSYARFFASYVADGIYFFTNWSAFSSGLTNNGFCIVTINEAGEVFKQLFRDGDREGYAENTKQNRALFRARFAVSNLMVSNSI
jgi:hypothetical protein